MVIFISSAGETPTPPPVTSDGVLFDGNDYFIKNSVLTGAANSSSLSAVWFFKLGVSIPTGYFLSMVNAPTGVTLYTASGNINYEIRNASETLLQGRVPISYGDGQWHCVMLSKSDSAFQIYVDDVEAPQVNTQANRPGSIEFASIAQTAIGAQPATGSRYQGELGYFYLNITTAIDFGIETNRRKFLAADGTPATNAAVLATSPIIFMQGNKDAWPINQGSGGVFTQYGLLDNGTTPILV